MESFFDSTTPFILIARIKVSKEKLEEYKKLAIHTDKSVKCYEPGMLHHTFDQDPDDDTSFTWSEVYENDAAFIKHLENPAVVEYLKKHGQTGWGQQFTVEVYGTVSQETKTIMKHTKLPIKFYKTYCGFSRVGEKEGCGCSFFG